MSPGKSFVLSKEHCRRPHVLSSLKIDLVGLLAEFLAWSASELAFAACGRLAYASSIVLGLAGSGWWGPVAQVVRAYA